MTGSIALVPDILVGNYQRIEDATLGGGWATGTTVVLAPPGTVGAVDVRGGAPGTRETDLLDPSNSVRHVDAIVLTGGSAYGLAAADGVMRWLESQGQGIPMGGPGMVVPIVPAAILYDLAHPGDKAWGETPPYRTLGMTALKNAATDFKLGRAGAGYGARAGTAPGGLGSASIVTDDGIIVGALAAVNAFGAATMPGTDVHWAWPFEQASEFGGARPTPGFTLDLDDWGAAKANPATRGQAEAGRTNTTLGCSTVDRTFLVRRKS